MKCKMLSYSSFQITPTLRNMWSNGYQVIVSYDEIIQVIHHSELWPAIPYWWGNKDTARKLIEVLEKKKQSGRPGICPFCIYCVYPESTQSSPP